MKRPSLFRLSFSISFCFCFCLCSPAQDTIHIDEPMDTVDFQIYPEGIEWIDPPEPTEPEFPGGQEAMFKFIQENLEYPQLLDEMGDPGITYIKFTIFKDGSLGKYQLIRGSEIMAWQMVKVFEMMPLWEPSMFMGEAIDMEYVIPLHVNPR